MLEAMIASDGDVQVEGQHVGWLAGFRFTPDTTAEDLDGKAVRTAAQKALAAEIQRRAEKLSLADDAAFVLDGEGAIRWTGEVVAKLSASDDILKPKIILLADEQLTGGAREIVDTRLSKWLTDQIEKHLGSLLALREGDGLEGIARGIGFRLAEELGAIDRREIAGDVKALEQEARATLRKHGVRFGAYALFVPQLLKPAPAGLLATLWALQNGGMDQPGLRELPQLNASGRTSIPVDESFDKRLYPIAGFRVCGRRAVRFDILERLADLIRPLVSFRVGQTEGEAPEGAAEGAGFTVTVEMTSLLGCAGDDFSEVLKSLGYKMERKTVPIKPAAPEAEVAKETEAETGAETKADTAAPTEPRAEASATEPATDEPIAAEVETTDAAPSLETPEPTTPSEAPPSDSADDATPSQASASEATEASQPSVSEASASEQGTAEDEEQPTEHIVEIWRPAPNRPRHQGRPGARRQGAGHGEGQEAGNGQQRGPRQKADKGKRPDRGDRRGKGPRRDGKGGKPSGPRTYTAAPPKKERQADPDSPFAALAGLLDNKDGDS